MSCKINVKDANFLKFLERADGNVQTALKNYLTIDNEFFNIGEDLSPMEELLSKIKDFESTRANDIIKTLQIQKKQANKSGMLLPEQELDIAKNINLMEERKDFIKEQFALFQSGNALALPENIRAMYNADKRFVLNQIAHNEDFAMSPEMLELHYRTVRHWYNLVDPHFQSNKALAEQLKNDQLNRPSDDPNSLVNVFNNIRTDAFSLMTTLNDLRLSKAVSIINEATQTNDTTLHDLTSPHKDVTFLASQTLDVTTENNLLAQAVGITTKRATVEAKTTVQDDLKALDALSAPASKAAYEEGYDSLWDALAQRDHNDNMTGAIIDMFSTKYVEKRRKLKRASEQHDSWEGYFKFALNEEFIFNPEVMVNSAHPDYEQSKQLLLDQLNGDEELFEDLIKEMNLKLRQYEIDRQQKESVYGKDSQEYKEWEVLNSPYMFSKQFLWARQNPNEDASITLERPDGSVIVTYPGGAKYMVTVPSRTYSDGTNTPWYDSKFDKIQANKELHDYWRYAKNLVSRLHDYLPYDHQMRNNPTAVPFLKKRAIELLTEGDVWKATATVGPEFMDILREQLRSDNTDEIAYITRTDPLTGEEIPVVQSGIHFTQRLREKQLIKAEVIAYEAKHNKKPSKKQLEEIQSSVRNMIFQDQSPDLSKVLKYYAILATTYKYKSKVEDSLRLLSDIYNETPKIKTNAIGKPYTNASDNSLVTDKTRTNAVRRMSAHLDHFMGYKRKDEGQLPIDAKITTKEEKARIKKIKQSLAEVEKMSDPVKANKLRAQLETELDKIGGVLTGGGILDQVLKLFQLKGIGWNIPAAFANMGFGQIGNFRYAAKGLEFNEDQMQLATAITLKHSMWKNYTFNQRETETAKKIRSVMDRFDILKDSSSELYKSGANLPWANKLRWMHPYQANQRAEYINQAPVMIASLMNKEIVSGVSFWEALDADGNLLPQYNNAENLEKMKRLKFQIDETIKKIHGNYDPDLPLAAKRRVIGRALVQFKTWMFEGYNSRWSDSYFNSLLGREDRGRYLSYINAGKAAYADKGILSVGKLAATSLLEGAKKATAAMITLGSFGRIKGRTLLDNVWKPSYNTLIEAEGFDDVDAANMYANATELGQIMLVTMFVLALKHLFHEDDEERSWTEIFLINQGQRITDDLYYYYNPVKQLRTLEKPIPSMGLIKETQLWLDSAKDAINNEPNKLGERTLRILPFTGSYQKMVSQGERVFNNRYY